MTFKKSSSLDSCDSTVASNPDRTVQREQPNDVKHLVFCVHGINSTPKEVEYLKNAMQEIYGDEGEIRYVCDNSNTGQTFDGFEVGGQRLSESIARELDSLISPKIYLSLIGYSLGGIYCRSALRYLDLEGDYGNRVIPLLFCTIASPNIGIASHTVFPNWLEKMSTNKLGTTGQDLNCKSELVHDMATTEVYLAPLRKFRQRIAVASAFHTDVIVPPATSAFLSKESTYPHQVIKDNRTMDASAYLMTVKTTAAPPQDSPMSAFGVTQSLDALGWTKIFLDLRNALPGPAFPRIRTKDPVAIPHQAKELSSKELHVIMSKKGTHWKIPLGHPMPIANPKHALYRKLVTPRGAPFADQLAEDLAYILQTEGESRFDQGESPRVRTMTKRFSQIILDGWYENLQRQEEEPSTMNETSPSVITP